MSWMKFRDLPPVGWRVEEDRSPAAQVMARAANLHMLKIGYAEQEVCISLHPRTAANPEGLRRWVKEVRVVIESRLR